MSERDEVPLFRPLPGGGWGYEVPGLPDTFERLGDEDEPPPPGEAAAALEADLAALRERFGPPHPRDPLPGQPALDLEEPEPLRKTGPNGERITACRSCGAPIYWSVTAAGRRVPIAVATGESHFRDCRDARAWSKKGKR